MTTLKIAAAIWMTAALIIPFLFFHHRSMKFHDFDPAAWFDSFTLSVFISGIFWFVFGFAPVAIIKFSWQFVQ